MSVSGGFSGCISPGGVKAMFPQMCHDVSAFELFGVCFFSYQHVNIRMCHTHVFYGTASVWYGPIHVIFAFAC